MGKLIFVMIDGLNYETAVSAMGYMKHLVEKKVAAEYKVKAELPTLSRPLYETILTGVPCYINGIGNNNIVRLSHEKSIFHLAKENNLKTAAAAYYWISELYNKAPFNYIDDREQEDEAAAIQYGKFYFEDSYPDSHLFLDGQVLIRKYSPDFIFIHPMGADYAGHAFGSDSKEYRAKAIEMDNILSTLLPIWIELGYDIVVSCDHGMDQNGLHCGVESKERYVPLWIISSKVKKEKYDLVIPQLAMAPMLCRLIGIQKSEKMIDDRYIQYI